MGYKSTLEANGLEIKEFKEFGSYQGTWIAETSDGKFIEGSYGSCSGCDSFQAEFDYSEDEYIEKDGKYFTSLWSGEEVSKESFDEHNAAHQEKLKQFGKPYVEGAETKEEIISRYEIKCAEDYAWEDDKEILEWLKSR